MICSLHHPRCEDPMVKLTDEKLSEAGELAGDAVEHLVANRGMSESEAVDLIADFLDMLIDLPDGVWAWVIGSAAGLLKRDPENMRKRAAKLEAKGKSKRAAKLRERADKVEAKG